MNASNERYGFAAAVSLVISNMIGVGILTTSGFMARDLPNVRWILIAWVIGGGLAMCGAVSYAELGAAYPKAGGEYVYLRRAFGPRVGFLSGWVSIFVGFAGPVAATAIGFTEYLSVFFPALASDPATSWFLVPGKWFAIGVIWLVSLIHASGVETSGRVQTGITVLKVGGLVILIAAGFAVGKGSFASFDSPPVVPTLGTMSAFAVAMIFVMFSYSGWNASTYVAGEIENPGRNIPLSILIGTAVVTVLYVALNGLYFFAVPPEEAAGVIRIGEVAADGLFGAVTARWLTLFFALSILACLSAMVVTGPRVCFAMSEDGCFFRTFAAIHPSWGTPARATFFQAGVATVYILTGTFDQIVTYCGFILFIFSALAVVALLRLRRIDPARPRPYRAWGYPVVPVVFALFCVWVVAFTLFERPVESVLGLLSLVLGLVFYRFVPEGQPD